MACARRGSLYRLSISFARQACVTWRTDAAARGRAEDAVSEIAALSVRLHATLVKVGLDRG